MYIDRIILTLIALAMIIGVVEGMITVKKVDQSQEQILKNQELLKQTLKLHDTNPGALIEKNEDLSKDHVH